MFKRSLLASVVILGSCSTFVDKAIQEVNFTTPGAYNAVCNVYVDKLRYKVRPPQVIIVNKSKETMVVDCLAPGNRRQKVYIEPEVTNTSAWNMATAGLGYPYDYASGALFKYPSHVIVDFTNAPVTDMPLPAQNQPDIRQPEDYDLEDFSPGSPRLNEDRNAIETRILRRGESAFGNEYDSGPYSDAPTSGKGDLMDVKPADQSQSSAGGPIQLIPGE